MLQQDLDLWSLLRCLSVLLSVLVAGSALSPCRSHDDVEDVGAMGVYCTAAGPNITRRWLGPLRSAVPLYRPISPLLSLQRVRRSHLFRGHPRPQNAIAWYNLAFVPECGSVTGQVLCRDLAVLGHLLAGVACRPVLPTLTFLLPLYPVKVALLLLVLKNLLLQSG